MRFEFFIARRYLFARRGQAFISVISWISVAGVSLGVASLIVVMSVMNGFTTDLRDKIVGVTSHAVIFSTGGTMNEDTDKLAKTIRAVPGVTGATPFIYSELMLSTQSGVKGVVLRGIDPASAPGVLGALDKLTEGSVADLADSGGLPGVIVGQALARKLGLTAVAEGVESMEDWQMLAELGCDIAQGYLIGRPVPGSELQAAIARWRRPAH